MLNHCQMILVPRPAPHLPRTLKLLQHVGITKLIPLAISHPQPISVGIPASATALIFTSPLGVQRGLPYLPAYCVGETTAEAARNAGYDVVYTGTNNGVTMANDLAFCPKTHFAHLHGDHAGMDWHAILKQSGHTVTPVLAYRTRRIAVLPDGFTNPAVTLLFSAGSASHLANLYKHANIPPLGTAVALSPAVAKAASGHWPHVVTASKPTLQAMIETLQSLNG